MLADIHADNRAWYEQNAAGWAHWLRAGGQWGEWTDNTASDVHFATLALHLNEGNTVLNLDCGWGRHAITLANSGMKVIGLDASAELLQLARETGERLSVRAEWVHGDLSDLELAEPTDAVVQFRSNLLEWAQSPAEALHLLDRVHAILKMDGRLLFGHPDWQATPPDQELSQAETPEATEAHHFYFDTHSRMIRFQTIITGRDGIRREYWRRTWYPTAEQMASLLYQADLTIEGQFNDFDFLPYNPDQPGLVWLAKKA